MTRLLTLGCSATKRPGAGLMPAIDRYDGPFYRTLRAAIRRGVPAPRLLILSAKFGLIDGETPIENYDQRLTHERARQLIESWPKHKGMIDAAARDAEAVMLCAGARYRLAISTAMPITKYPRPIVSVAEGGIGEQLGQLKAWLEAKP